MEVEPLYEIVLWKVLNCLKSGLWNSLEKHPVSELPPKILNNLMECASYRFSLRNTLSISDLEPIITSRKLQSLVVSENLMGSNWQLLQKWLTQEVCQCLKTYKVFRVISNWELDDILKFCVNLEVFCGKVDRSPDLDMFRNCKKLRVLKISHTSGRWNHFKCPESLGILEIFICLGAIAPKMLAVVVLKCPNLISLGTSDLLNALPHIIRLGRNPLSIFNLRRCSWDSSVLDDTSGRHNVPQLLKYFTKRFPQIYDILVLVKRSKIIPFLSHFTCLNRLNIRIEADTDNEPSEEFYTLLTTLGSQLKYLAVSDEMKDILLDTIFDSCPFLETLIFGGHAVIRHGERLNTEKYKCHPLKELCMITNSDDAVMFILKNFTHLKVIYIESAEWLKDDHIDEILETNSFSELEEIWLGDTSLSETGLNTFLRMAVSLQQVFIRIKREGKPEHGRMFGLADYFECGLFIDDMLEY